jgi:hypothetical protein
LMVFTLIEARGCVPATWKGYLAWGGFRLVVDGWALAAKKNGGMEALRVLYFLSLLGPSSVR